jgi:hypothetical protein
MSNPKFTKNEYYNNAAEIFKIVSKEIVDDNLNDKWAVIQNTLFFAIGIEKILKSILYNVNPLYILEKPDFKNSVPVQYSNYMKNDFEIIKNPDADVIAYQSSVFRSQIFSKTITDNKNTLLSLKHYRDIIAHHKLDGLDIDAMKILLKRDFYPFLSKLSTEFNMSAANGLFFNNLNSQLAHISSSLQDDIEKKIELRIEGLKARWIQKSGSHTFNTDECEKSTIELLRKDFAYPTICPCCGNYAVVFTIPVMQYDSYRQELVKSGYETKGLECKFCELKLSDYKEFDFLNVKPDIESKSSVIERYDGTAAE